MRGREVEVEEQGGGWQRWDLMAPKERGNGRLYSGTEMGFDGTKREGNRASH